MSNRLKEVPQKDPTSGSKVKITLGDLKGAESSIKKLLAFDLPVKTSWSLRKNVKVFEAELKHFSDEHLSLLKKHGEEKENGLFTILDGKMREYQDDFKTLTEIEVELDVVLINLNALEAFKMSSIDMAVLEPFLTT